MPSSSARATARSWSRAAPRVMSPPTAPQPKPSGYTSRPVLPRVRRSITVSFCGIGSCGIVSARKRGDAMDCCGHEGLGAGDARFDVKKIADGVHVAVGAPAYKVNCNTAIIESDDGVMVVDTHSKPSAA